MIVFTKSLIVYIERIYLPVTERKSFMRACRISLLRKYSMSRKITSINTDIYH